jgi:branched-chain amino acid transport system ATP-binding protein
LVDNQPWTDALTLWGRLCWGKHRTSAGLSPVRQDETFIRTRRINKAGVSVIMVEQNARRCLQIADRGYVLDQGRDAYTGTGRELADDPKVIELYLGTLAKDVDAK